ncbi:hypothetical protein M5K25_013560 [Dendrobium thyrsiflorum]|uniref:Uncharacterized protein n=1 Tax=Dendrobium thyrsiflorum TaxID=117978 RepID=A0ABD0V175_DENTH
MKVEQVLHMVGGVGGNSYANNSKLQLLMLYGKQLRENKGADNVNLYAVGLPGSFYGRLFPTKTVHFFHSSYSLMWLSQVPQGLDEKSCAHLNKRNIYIADASSSIVYHLYLNQFKKDFSEFLRSRSKELIFGGKMVLSFLGRKNSPAIGDLFKLWSLLADALKSMISEGLVEEAKVNAFNLPIYAPLMEEVKSIIEMEGSFHVDEAQTFETNWDPFDDSTDNFVINSTLSGQNVAKYLRTVLEPLLICHFGGDIIEVLFSRYAQNITRHISKEKAKFVVLILALKLKV